MNISDRLRWTAADLELLPDRSETQTLFFAGSSGVLDC
jgi:hypothetical protein